MLSKIIFCLLAFSALAVAAENFTMPNVKEGLWEVTVTHPSGGLPGMPEDVLAKMPPEQRARIEEMMKQKGVSMSGNTTVVKNCVTKEKIAKGMAFADEKQKNCSHTIVSSSSSHVEVKFHCDETRKDGSKTTVDGTTTVDVMNDDSTKGTTHIVTSGGDKPMTMDLTFTSKYLGSSCGDLK